MSLAPTPLHRRAPTRVALAVVGLTGLSLLAAGCIGGAIPLPPGGIGQPTTTTTAPTSTTTPTSTTSAPVTTTSGAPPTTTTPPTTTAPTSTTTPSTTTPPTTTTTPAPTTTIADDGQPHVFFLRPADGATVTSPVTLELGALNFEVEAAGQARPGAGHLHVMIDAPCVAPGAEIPRDAAHVHYGNGQLQASLVLTPGPHHLCLQAGDGLHKALPLTDELDLTVSA